MTNGKEVLNELRFEEMIKKKTDRELLEFTARETYFMSGKVALNTKRSVVNRIVLIALICILIGLGVLDSGLVHFFGMCWRWLCFAI